MASRQTHGHYMMRSGSLAPLLCPSELLLSVHVAVAKQVLRRQRAARPSSLLLLPSENGVPHVQISKKSSDRLLNPPF